MNSSNFCSLFLSAVLTKLIWLNNLSNKAFKKVAQGHISTGNKTSFKRLSFFLHTIYVANWIPLSQMRNKLDKLSFLSLFLTAVLIRFIWLNNLSNETSEKGAQGHVFTSNSAGFKTLSSFLHTILCIVY